MGNPETSVTLSTRQRMKTNKKTHTIPKANPKKKTNTDPTKKYRGLNPVLANGKQFLYHTVGTIPNTIEKS